jgi:HEAT repeat protein
MRQTVETCGFAVALAWVMVLGGCGNDAAATKATSAEQAAQLAALQQLPAQNNEKALATAVQAVQNEDVVTARAAVRAIGRMSQQDAPAALAKVITEDRRPEIREEAALALSSSTTEASVETLREVIQKDEAPKVRAAAAIGLGRTGSLRDVEFLLRAAETEKNPVVQYQTVGALEKILGIGFTIDPGLSPERRKITMERIRIAATIRARALRDQARTRPETGARRG